MKIKISSPTKTSLFQYIRTRRVAEKVLLFSVLSFVIGYLISPKIVLEPTIYEEGDIILRTINIDEDLLIPDKVSTRLKTEQLLKDQRPIYDFDPNILVKSQNTVREAFQTIRDQFGQLEKQEKEIEKRKRSLGMAYFSSIISDQELESQINHYQQYMVILRNRLKELQGEDTLSAKNFFRKKQLDADLNTVSQLLVDILEKQKYFRRQQNSFDERFYQLSTESETFQQSIAEQKRVAVQNFDKMLFIELSDVERQSLDFAFFSEEIETQLQKLLSEILRQKIVISKTVFFQDGKEEFEIRNLVTGEATRFQKLDNIYDLQEAKDRISGIGSGFFINDETGKKKNLIIMLGQKLVRPTVSENKLEYEKRKEDLIANVSPVFFSVKKGEIIARAGDRVSRHQVELINSYYDAMSNIDKLPRMIGVMLFVLFSLLLVSFTFQFSEKTIQLSFKQLCLILISVLVTLLLVKGGAVIGEIVEIRYLESQSSIYAYVLPVALGAMLVGILLDFQAALLTGLLTSLFCSLMMQGSLYYFFYAITGSIVASLPMTQFESRYSLLLHGVKISAVNFPMMIIIYLIESNQIGSLDWLSIGLALVSGILTAILTSFILPFFESIFDITTNLKLLELSNMNHPALKDLILHSPGTYQHSIIVGNLAESGAMKIGANPLLSRVSAYYHDIGKAVEPHYYIENQSPGLSNIHDHMNPYDSAQVIINHIKKGEEIAEKYRLGKAITDILRQHHGTNLVKYFYNKACEESVQRGDEQLPDQNQFRYLGPKPQSLEAALVMLADIAEASSRSLNKPTAELVREIVEKVCQNVLEDGQLDESGLTLQTYHAIIDIYCSMLISIHHHRIAYPDNKHTTVSAERVN